ncbi:MAG: EAL domain-containing protein [Deinococcales bacterium]
MLAATEAASREFLEEPDWAAAVDGMLTRLGRAIGAARAALLEFEVARPGVTDGVERRVDVPLVRRWESAEAAAWVEGRPPYGTKLLEWASSPPGFAGHVDEAPAHDRDALHALGVGYVALLPVLAGDGVTRVLAFEWTAPVPRWLPLVVDTLRAAPATLEAAVRRRSGELASERSRRYQASLLEVTRELLAQEVTPSFYQTLLERAVEVIPGAQAGCVLVRGSDGRFALTAGTGAEVAALAGARFVERDLQHDGGAGVGPRLLKGDALDRGVEGERGRATREAGAGPGPAVSLAVPVVLRGRLEASLRLDNLEAEGGFPPEAVGMAEAFGLQVAALLQRLRLEERRDLAARMNALIADIERLLLAGGDLADFFPVLARLVLDVPGMGFDRMAVLRQGDDGVAVDAYDPEGAHDEGLEAAMHDAGWAGGGRGPLAAQGRDVRPRFQEEAREGEPVAAYAAQPLMLRGQPWGVIVFCSGGPRAFDGHVRDTLAQLAGSIELALVRQEDAAQREWQLAKLEAVVSTSETLRGATRRRDVLLGSLQAVLEMTRADVCDLFLIDAEADALRLVGSRAGRGQAAHPVGELIVPRGPGLAWRVVEGGRTVGARDAAGLAEVEIPARAARPVAYLGTPLRNGDGDVVGVVSALVHAGGRAFEREDAGFLEAIALACGNALDRLALVEQSRAQAGEYRSLFEAAQRQAAELTLLDRVRGAVASELDLQAVFARAAEATVEVLGYRRVGVFSRSGDDLVLQHQLGYDGDDEREALDGGGVARVARRVAETGEPLLIGGGSSRAPGDATESPWQAAVPLVAGEGVVGVLVAEGRAAGSGEEDLRLLRALGEQLGVAAERGRLYDAVRHSEQRFRLLAEHMQDLVCLHDRDGRYEYVSPSSVTVLGYGPEELVGRDPYELIHEEDRQRVRESAHQRLFEGQASVQVGYRIRHADGHHIWLETMAQPVRDERGEVVNLVTSSRDITERKRIEERLVQGALFDELTGLPNRVLLLDRLRQALSRSARNEAWRFALLFLDLDRFKVVNDSLGHNAGDELLKSLGTRLKSCVRGSDTVARLGGDEFCVLIEDVDGPDHATATAARIQSALTEPFTLHGNDIFTSASIGIAFSAPQYRDPQELLRDADIAMYRAKAAGKARFAVFDERMHARALGQMQLETSLHRAPERNEFFLEYQPVYQLGQRRLVGVEALLRWRHPERGLVPPSEFVPLAEESGQIVAIDRWVLRQATQQLARWHQALGSAAALPVLSVNVSARNLALQDVDAILRSTLEEVGLPASCLKLEIGEGALMSYPEAAVESLTRLHELGVLVQVDDFGTGFSSLKHLQRLPIDSLKIDRSFVRRIDVEAANREVVGTIVGLARNLGIDVVAEGIERDEELEALIAMGCGYGQGYLFAPPLPPDEVTRRLHAQRAL